MWSVMLRGTFAPYLPALSAQIEREYQRGVSSARVSLNGHDYDLIFAEMKQRSATQPGKKRPIRRDALPVTRVIRPRTAGDPLVSNTSDADAETTADTTRPTVEAQATAASVADPSRLLQRLWRTLTPIRGQGWPGTVGHEPTTIEISINTQHGGK